MSLIQPKLRISKGTPITQISGGIVTSVPTIRISWELND